MTFTATVNELAGWLAAEGVTEVAMEATGVYWKPVWDVLEEAGFEVKLVNPQHIESVPGRKTDVKDAQWIAQLLDRSANTPPQRTRR